VCGSSASMRTTSVVTASLSISPFYRSRGGVRQAMDAKDGSACRLLRAGQFGAKSRLVHRPQFQMAAQHRHSRAGAASEARREREVDVVAHTHSHSPSGSDASARQALTRALILTGTFALVEAAGGWLAGSLALLSDAGHLFTDTAALGLALFAQWIARRPPSRRASYGYARAEVLAAFINALALDRKSTRLNSSHQI